MKTDVTKGGVYSVSLPRGECDRKVTERLVAHAKDLRSTSYDRKRDTWIENEFLLKTGEVFEVIREHCLRHPPLHPLPSPKVGALSKGGGLKESIRIP